MRRLAARGVCHVAAVCRVVVVTEVFLAVAETDFTERLPLVLASALLLLAAVARGQLRTAPSVQGGPNLSHQ